MLGALARPAGRYHKYWVRTAEWKYFFFFVALHFRRSLVRHLAESANLFHPSRVRFGSSALTACQKANRRSLPRSHGSPGSISLLPLSTQVPALLKVIVPSGSHYHILCESKLSWCWKGLVSAVGFPREKGGPGRTVC